MDLSAIFSDLLNAAGSLATGLLLVTLRWAAILRARAHTIWRKPKRTWSESGPVVEPRHAAWAGGR